jgi:hypothetical protein
MTPTAESPVVVELEPGTYSRVAIGWTLPGFVRLEGSGMDETVVTCNCTTITLNGTATIADLTVASVDASNGLSTIDARDDILRVKSARVTMTSIWLASQTIRLDEGGSASLVDSIAERHNPSSTNGNVITVDGGATLDIDRSRLVATGTAVEAITAESASISITDSDISSEGTTLFTCCQETGETLDWTIRRSTISGVTAISVNGLTDIDIDGSLIIRTGSFSAITGSTTGSTVVRNTTVVSGSVTGGATCIGISTATTFLTSTCPT